MEKTIDKFKNTAVVVIKDKPIKPKTKVEELLSTSRDYIFTSLPLEYCIKYDLYINGEKIDGDYLLVDGDKILDAETCTEIIEDDIKHHLVDKEYLKNKHKDSVERLARLKLERKSKYL